MPAGGGCKTVAEIEPADHSTDIKRSVYWVELKPGARHPRSVGKDGSWNHRSQQFGALGEFQGLDRATERIHQAVARRAVGFGADDLIVADVISDVGEYRVRGGTRAGVMR